MIDLLDNKVVITVSSRALFKLEDSNKVLKEFKPHIFLDDSFSYCLPASRFVSTGHVTSGTKNK